MAITVAVSFALLGHISGLSAAVAAAADYASDRAPVIAGIEREARVTMAHPQPIGSLGTLVSQWRVRVEGFQHTYPAPYRPITTGLAVVKGSSVRSAAAQHQAELLSWLDLRVARAQQLVLTSGPESRASAEQNLADLRTVRDQVSLGGALVSVIDVRGSAADVEALRRDPAVRSLAAR